MKKLAVSVLSIAFAMSVSASTLTWGQWGGVESWLEGADAETAYASVYLLTGDGATPTFDAASGTWNMNGATFITKGAYDPNNSGWGDPVGTDYAAVNAGSSAGAEQQYFAIYLTSEETSDLSTFVGDGKYFVLAATDQGMQFDMPNLGQATVYGTDISGWDNVARSSWTEAKPVPEPTSVALLALGLAALGLKRKIA